MDSFAFVVFGITSNLAQIKLIPALYDMAESGLLPEQILIVGAARSPMNRVQFHDFVVKALHTENRHHQHSIKEDVLQKLLDKMHYLDGHLDDAQFYLRLQKFLDAESRQGFHCENRIFYLATYPDLYTTIFEQLQTHNLNKQDKGWVRLMIEKPIGNDLQSAKALNQLLDQYFEEEQIYRLDHYLGKETLQNILTFRFANSIFEPLMSSEFVDHIQVTAAEDFGIGARGGYYDTVGALKDVGQNHLLQMIAFTTMDAPHQFSNQAVTSERIKILENLVPDPQKVVFGQYKGYQDELKVALNSTTDTFFAFRTTLKSGRLKDVPIYVRGGKKLAQTATEVSVVFKDVRSALFPHQTPNALIYRVQPNEGIVFKIDTKKPGASLELEPTYMQFCYRQHAAQLPDPYERLIADCLRGDQTFFNDATEVEAAWAFIDPLHEQRKAPHIYEMGSWGPKAADQLMQTDGREWLLPSMDFCRL